MFSRCFQISYFHLQNIHNLFFLYMYIILFKELGALRFIWIAQRWPQPSSIEVFGSICWHGFLLQSSNRSNPYIQLYIASVFIFGLKAQHGKAICPISHQWSSSLRPFSSNISDTRVLPLKSRTLVTLGINTILSF